MRRSRIVIGVAAALLLVAVVAAAGLALSSGSSGPGAAGDRLTAVPRARADTRILIVGDSLTQGSAGDVTWRYWLWQHLENAEESVDLVGPRRDLFDIVTRTFGSHEYLNPDFDQDHAAVWGQRLARARDTILAQVVAYQPDVVVVLLGLNDLEGAEATPAEVAQTMGDFVERVRLGRADTDIVIARLPSTNYPGVNEVNSWIESSGAVLSTPQSQVVVAETDAGFAVLQDTWDPAHPNANGEIKIAAAVADALSLLGIGQPYPRPLSPVPLGPRIPAQLSLAAVGTEVRLRWTRPPGATGQLLWLRDVSTGAAWVQRPEELPGRTVEVTDLVPGHTYDFMLQPVKGWWPAADDIRSNVVRATPHSQPSRAGG